MKSESLLSARSNLSQLSNVSYRAEKQEYCGSQFFKESLPFAFNKMPGNEVRLEQIQLDSLGPGFFNHFQPIKDSHSAFIPYWTSELEENIQGTSDNEEELETVKKQPDDLIEEVQESEKQPFSVEEKKQSSSVSEGKNLKNQTKNIPKNYGKAIIIFFEKNRPLIEGVLEEQGSDYNEILGKLKALKKKINTISDLKQLWQFHPESKSLRIVSNYFLRKHSLHYIYNSRIKTRLCHAKYKRRLQEAIRNPKEFNYIKDY